MQLQIPSRPQRRQIIIVEDDPACAEFLATWARLVCDLDVVGEARTLAKAKSLLTAVRPDLVLTDFCLPDGTGAEVSVFARRELGDVFVVMLTGDSSAETRWAARAAGVDLYVEKGQPLDQVADALTQSGMVNRKVAPTP